MRFQPLALSVIVATSLFSAHLQANELRKVFDYYAQGSPGTYKTSDMKHWQGASFSGRSALSDPTLVQMPTINIGGSCKGIDFHAGGFGLVTKDELVQMARGIAQGAPGYFFNMAIGAVCSSCLQNINEYMRKLERFNELTRNSCEKFWNAVTNPSASAGDRASANASSKGALDDAVNGTLKSWGDTLDKIYNPNEPGRAADGVTEASAKKVLNENVVYRRMKSAFNGTYQVTPLPGADITVSEMAMSLFGTVITRIKANTTDEIVIDTRPAAKGLSPSSLLFGPKQGESISFYKCDEESALPKDKECLDLREVEDTSFKGLKNTFELLLVGTSTDPGIIERIHSRENLTAPQLSFVTSFQMPYLKVAEQKVPALRKQVGERFALMVAQKIVNDAYAETSAVLYRALKAERSGDDSKTVDYRAQIKAEMEKAERDVKTMNDEVDREIEKLDKTLTVSLTLEQLRSLNDETVGLR